ncbi:MAG: phosphatidylglycerophosphatase A [Legionellales bacterium]|nr:phosphatidylglycerophosphatase A [Legionellales bacterium]
MAKKSGIKNIDVWRNPIYFLGFGFGLGLFPKMPGTFGTLGAIPLYLLILDFSLVNYVVLCTILFILGVYICTITEIDSGIEDNPKIVWDEIVGFLVALSVTPVSIYWIIYAFVVFRVLDIIKPWPIYIIEKKTSSGLSIMIDDLVAGIMTALIIGISLIFV